MIAKCLYNDPFNLPSGISNDFDFGLIVGKSYFVMGIILFGKDIKILVDEEGRPSWFPIELFDMIDNKIENDWFFIVPNSIEIKAIWGFDELCNDENYFDSLACRDEKALEIYFKKKSEYYF